MMDDEVDDDLKFAAGPNSFKDETNLLAPAKELEFREFLCDSGATEELLRILVGLAEASPKPEDPIGYLRSEFDSQDLPNMISGRVRDDIPALIAENEALKEREESLSAQLQAAVAAVEAQEAAAAGAVIDGLLGGGAFASESCEGALDLGKLCTRQCPCYACPLSPARQATLTSAAACSRPQMRHYLRAFLLRLRTRSNLPCGLPMRHLLVRSPLPVWLLGLRRRLGMAQCLSREVLIWLSWPGPLMRLRRATLTKRSLRDCTRHAWQRSGILRRQPPRRQQLLRQLLPQRLSRRLRSSTADS
jgi:hypothetical protein